MSQLWQKVRSWIRRGVKGTAPRPLPILLEDLYSPAARATYRSTRTWEARFVATLPSQGPEANRLLDNVLEVAREIRRHLLLIQRARHLANYQPNANFDRVWREYRLTWSSPLVLDVETMLELSAPLEGNLSMSARDRAAIARQVQHIGASVQDMNGRLRAALGRAPSIVSSAQPVVF